MMPEQMNSYVRILHASPNAPAVDIYANGDVIVKNLAYKEFTQYLPVPSGNYNVTVYPTGKTENPVIDTDIYIPDNGLTNLAAIGELPDIRLFQVSESIIPANYGNPCVRFVHLSPNAPAVDIKLEDDTIVYEDVSYKDVTNYVCVPAETYSFKVTPTGSDDVVLTIPNVQLNSNNLYTIYAAGLVGGSPELEVLLISEPRK
jgi:hypothetical protein